VVVVQAVRRRRRGMVMSGIVFFMGTILVNRLGRGKEGEVVGSGGWGEPADAWPGQRGRGNREQRLW
jgi:hypothetical protein